jgi:hypothetical protein
MRVRSVLFITAACVLLCVAGFAAAARDRNGCAGSPHVDTNAHTPSWTARMEDPTTWDRSWSIRMPLKRDDTQAIFEFGCHEGSRALENIMRAARAEDARKAGEGR